MAGEKRFSTLNFYKTELNEAKNAYVDDLEDYLDSCTLTVTEQIDDFQYIRHDLNISIKIDKDQSWVNNFNYNYIKIVNTLGAMDEDFVGYYFVTKTTQIAPETILLDLKLDTINSLGQGNTDGCNPRNFLSTTKVQRQHKSRFIKPSSWTPGIGTLYRNIDAQSEGIIPQQVKTYDHKLESSDGLDWYLIYRNREQVDAEHPNPPVDTLLCASEEFTIGTQSWGDSKTFVASDFAEGNYYYFLDVDEPIGEFSIDNGTRQRFGNATKNIVSGATGTYYSQAAYWSTTLNYTTTPLRALIIKRDGNQLKYRLWDNRNITFENFSGSRAANVSISIQNEESFTNCTSITFYEATFLRYSSTNYIDQTPEGIKALVSQQLGVYVGSHLTQTISTIDDLDRTDSKLIKIIKLPYCPVKYTKVNNIYDFGDDWEYSLGLLRYNKDNIPQFEFDSVVSTGLLVEPTFLVLEDTPGYRDDKDLKHESKLYHSDFSSYKLVYDSFSKLIKPELFVKKTLPAPIIPIDFKPTSTINSKFGFKLDYSNYGSYASEEDFGDILLATRNNEETILNNEYLNYIKTGYNYDKKAQALQIEQAQRNAAISTATTALSTIGTILSFALAGPTSGASIPVGIGLATSTAVSGINTANQWANVSDTQDKIKNSMQAKLSQLAAQSASTSGTDDVDLMTWYSDNRLHEIIYRPTALILNQLYHVFDLTGYIDNNTWTPDVDSRIWYNFIQCNPELEFDTTKGYKNSWLEDLKQKYNNGVTVYHRNNIGGQYDKWNFDQQWENWETWIVEGVN